MAHGARAWKAVGAWFETRLWSVYSRVYDGLLDLLPYRELIADVVDRLEVSHDDSVVDLGCGTGNTLTEILRREPGARALGVDASADMLAVAHRKLRHRTSVHLELGDLNEWLADAPSGSVDRLVSVNVLYTFDEEQRRRFWKESLRVLRPSGRLVLVTSDRAGIGPVVRDQWRRRNSVFTVLPPRLAAVAVLNLVIWAFETNDVFHPVAFEKLRHECESAGGAVIEYRRCYGGEADGVDVLLVIEPIVRLQGDVIDLSDLPNAAVDERPAVGES
jgi:SAM-dependent methyltransferase